MKRGKDLYRKERRWRHVQAMRLIESMAAWLRDELAPGIVAFFQAFLERLRAFGLAAATAVAAAVELAIAGARQT